MTGRNHGFTMIEVMLFLAVSGLLMVGILAGSGAAINNQRYSDTVYSLQSELQAQYSATNDIFNTCRGSAAGCSENLNCTLSGTTLAVTPVSGEARELLRGWSDCLILGRYITTTSGGSQLVVRGVVGMKTDPSVIGSDDVNDLRLYRLNAVPTPYTNDADSQAQLQYLGGSVYDTEWRQNLLAKGGAKAQYGILILRSPISGRTYTFIAANDSSSPQTVLGSASNLSNNATFCIDNSGASQAMMAVRVDANGSGPSSVEVLGDQAVKDGSTC